MTPPAGQPDTFDDGDAQHAAGQRKYSGAALMSDSGVSVASEVEIAATWWRRFKGLQFRKPLPDGHAILLRPCSSIHTFWMRFAIDVVFVDESGRMVQIERNVGPWRTVIAKIRSAAVLEMTSGSLPAKLTVGDILTWKSGEHHWPLLESPPTK